MEEKIKYSYDIDKSENGYVLSVAISNNRDDKPTFILFSHIFSSENSAKEIAEKAIYNLKLYGLNTMVSEEILKTFISESFDLATRIA